MAIHFIENVVDGKEDVIELISLLKKDETNKIGFDTETTGLDPFTSKPLLVQIEVGGEIYVMDAIRIGKDFFLNLLSLINKRKILCIGHNIKFDSKIMKVHTGIWLENVYDTMIAEAVLMAGIGKKLYSLSYLVQKYCDVFMEKDVRNEFINFNTSNRFTEQQIIYSAKDTLYLYDIYNKQIKKAGEDKLLSIVNMEMELAPVVMEMEYRGITLDVKHWKELIVESEGLKKESERKTKELIFQSVKKNLYSNAYEFAKALLIPIKTKKLKMSLELITDPNSIAEWIYEKFNLGSPLQLKTALTLCGINVENTNEKTLLKLPKHSIIDSILEFRDYEKRLSTYGQNIIDLINPVTGRIHTEYFQEGTATGRFSSTNPNLQNMPVHNGFREGFVARPGYSFIAVDYSQQEYRLAGALSKEPVIIDAYRSGYDMHTATASLRFGKEFRDITKDERSKGKTINFAVLYGTTAWGLARNLQIPTKEGEELLAKFFSGYPRLSEFKNIVEDFVVKLGYSVTPMGRKRFFNPLPTFGSPKEIEKKIAQMKREGFNHVIQGGGADVTKLAMINISKRNPFKDLLFLLLQVHDEIVFEVEDSILDQAIEFVCNEMKAAFQPLLGEIPAMVDYKVSKCWTKS